MPRDLKRGGAFRIVTVRPGGRTVPKTAVQWTVRRWYGNGGLLITLDGTGWWTGRLSNESNYQSLIVRIVFDFNWAVWDAVRGDTEDCARQWLSMDDRDGNVGERASAGQMRSQASGVEAPDVRLSKSSAVCRGERRTNGIDVTGEGAQRAWAIAARQRRGQRGTRREGLRGHIARMGKQRAVAPRMSVRAAAMCGRHVAQTMPRVASMRWHRSMAATAASDDSAHVREVEGVASTPGAAGDRGTEGKTGNVGDSGSVTAHRGKEELEGVSDEEGRVEGTMRKLLLVARKSRMRSSIDTRCAALGMDQRFQAILRRYECSSLAMYWIGEVAERLGATATPYVRVIQNPGQGEKDFRGWEAGMRNRRGRTYTEAGLVESYVRRIAIGYAREGGIAGAEAGGAGGRRATGGAGAASRRRWWGKKAWRQWWAQRTRSMMPVHSRLIRARSEKEWGVVNYPVSDSTGINFDVCGGIPSVFPERVHTEYTPTIRQCRKRAQTWKGWLVLFNTTTSVIDGLNNPRKSAANVKLDSGTVRDWVIDHLSKEYPPENAKTGSQNEPSRRRQIAGLAEN
ncbi:hypothetical protein DFH08DRAFT_803945 [Mycena albidolilacea]|uniref:Uncharacterized protein n=1 Tax=Mycena albidolilacea TaxID=1033008 RepID=A0AAD7AB10_9AGAR|nr:hypothetical protein DFH08DRAFT_803945 [Mycena albidolilacea]